MNPLKNNFYKAYDILYFIFSFIFNTFLINYNKSGDIYTNKSEYKNIFIEIGRIFNFNNNYEIIFKNKFKKANRYNVFLISSKKEYFEEILGSSVNLQYFIPKTQPYVVQGCVCVYVKL